VKRLRNKIGFVRDRLRNRRAPLLRFLRVKATDNSVFVAGESYTESEHREWLTAAGFVDIDRSLLADGGSLITARKLK
jgi:hypothetical protein